MDNKFYKFELNEEKYKKFKNMYSSCFRVNFFPKHSLFTYYSKINELFWSENIYCFKKYKFVPNVLEISCK